MKKVSTSEEINKILLHPDKEELLSKLILDIPIEDIHEWLSVKYSNNKNLILSKRILNDFKDNYLDFYTLIKEDLQKTINKQATPEEEIQLNLQNNSAYQNKLKKYLDQELDIQTILRTLIAKIEHRAECLFDEISNDPRNIKIDRTLIEWMNLLLTTVEKYQPILNGPSNQVNVQNNINITLFDQKMNIFSEVVRETLAEMDYEASLLFMEQYSKKLAMIQDLPAPILPQEIRLEEAEKLSSDIAEKS